MVADDIMIQRKTQAGFESGTMSLRRAYIAFGATDAVVVVFGVNAACLLELQ